MDINGQEGRVRSSKARVGLMIFHLQRTRKYFLKVDFVSSVCHYLFLDIQYAIAIIYH